jgi:hypothetical protein
MDPLFRAPSDSSRLSAEPTFAPFTPHVQNRFCRIFGSWVVTTPIGLRRGSGITPEALVLLATAASPGPADMKPATAIAIIPAAKIDPNMAFALSHRLNARWFSGDIRL